MNTSSGALKFISIVWIVVCWLRVGGIVYKRMIGRDKEDDDRVVGLLVCLGPLLVVVIIAFRLLAPVVGFVDSIVAAVWDDWRIMREAEAAREISEAEPAYDPTTYKPGQWKDETWREELKRQRSTTSSSVTRSALRIRRSGRSRKTNGQA